MCTSSYKTGLQLNVAICYKYKYKRFKIVCNAQLNLLLRLTFKYQIHQTTKVHTLLLLACKTGAAR